MSPQLDVQILSSLLLYMDYKILSEGAAYINYSGLFYPTSSNIQGIWAYSAPYKQLVNDTSIAGATVMSGVYLNNTFVTVGTSGLSAINHYQGTLYFTSPLPKNTLISGNYAVKEYSIQMTNEIEQKLLFNTKYVTNNEYALSTISGLPLDAKTAPCIFLKVREQDQKPFAIGNYDDSRIRVRAIVISDTEYQKINVNNILKSLHYHYMPYITSLPIDAQGNMTGVNYNYPALPINTGFTPLILDVKTIDVPIQGDFRDILRHMSFADITLSTITVRT